VFCLAACQNQAPQTGPSLRVVDHEAVFRQSEAGQKSMTYLQDMNQKFMTELGEMQKQEAATEEEQAKLQAEMQASMNNFRMQLTTEQERIVGILNEAFTKAIEDYRQAQNVSMVLAVENVIAYDPALNATDDIIAAMNAMNIDIEPAAEEAQAEEPAADTESEAKPAE
jgi:outer membrane protein